MCCNGNHLTAYPPLNPPSFTTSPELRKQDLNLDAFGQVGAESTQISTSAAIVDAFDNNKECCGKTAATGASGLMADAKRSRGYVKGEVNINKDLVTMLPDSVGAMNKVGAPWDNLIPTGALDPQVPRITIAYTPKELQPVFPPYQEFHGVGTVSGAKVKIITDPGTGRSISVIVELNSADSTKAEFKFDAFGRLIESTNNMDDPAEVTKIYNDWLTGNVQFREGPGEGDQTAESHMPGHTRNQLFVPEEWRQNWFIRGSHGQVKFAIDDSGVVTDFYGYSSLGNRTGHDIYSGTGILPWYLDGDQSPISQFEQMKVGSGTTQDMTQMIGALDSPKESGGAGEGACGNPNVQGTGNATFLQNNGRQGFYAGGQWHDTSAHTMPAYLPGTGSDKAPTFAPPTVQDQATQADKRLADTWGPQKFHGPKPGKQTGSRYVDDTRDMFKPLPAYPIAGGVTGPSGFAPGGRWAELMPLPQPLPAYPAGPPPMLPNPDGAGSGGGNGNTSADDSYHNSMEKAAGGSFARRDQGASRGKQNGREVLDSIHDKPGNGNPPPDSDPIQDAMDASDSVWQRINDALWGWTGRTIDDGDPDTGQSRAVSDFFDVAPGVNLYQIADRATDGAISRSVDSMNANDYDNLATALIVGDMVVNVVSAVCMVAAPGSVAAKAGAKTGSKSVQTGAGLIDDVAGSGTKAGAKASRLVRNKLSGDTIRDAVAEGLVDAEKEVYMATSRGARYIDILSEEIAHEVKSGRVSASKRIVEQVLKDAELLNTKQVKGVKWIFREGKTGSGPTAGLRKLLNEHGITILE